MKQPFHPQINKPCFIKGINKKGIAKEARLSDEQTKVTYFSRENDQRITAWFSNSQLEEYKPKKLKEREDLDALFNLVGSKLDDSLSGISAAMRKIVQSAISNDISVAEPKAQLNDYEMIKDVHTKFNSKVAKIPTMLTRDDYCDSYGDHIASISTQMKQLSADGYGGEALVRAAYIIEEVAEFLKATTLKDQIDALGDARYFIGGTTVMAGIDLDPIMKIINDSNLGKLWSDGKPRFNETGKWIKPDNWQKDFAPEPKIEAEIERQAAVASKN
ncbi:hypothetical protein ACH6EH_07350 [Paenibacillus sp. JSM ZJ436]|uniref:hypothetical protein n=1 Tax=Paenibacillus sp. JSM ZJ436 TaxID=3376190 RepID=UPI0037B4027F